MGANKTVSALVEYFQRTYAMPQKQAADIEALKPQVADLTAQLTVKQEAPKPKKEKKVKPANS